MRRRQTPEVQNVCPAVVDSQLLCWCLWLKKACEHHEAQQTLGSTWICYSVNTPPSTHTQTMEGGLALCCFFCWLHLWQTWAYLWLVVCLAQSQPGGRLQWTACRQCWSQWADFERIHEPCSDLQWPKQHVKGSGDFFTSPVTTSVFLVLWEAEETDTVILNKVL